MAHAKNMVRLRNPETGKYLHQSAKGEVNTIAYSWLGLPHQAHTLRARANTANTPFPYRIIPRALTEPTTPDGQDAYS